MGTHRRTFVRLGLIAVGGGLAGCLGGDESLEEIDASMEQADVHLSAAEEHFDALEMHLDAEEWDQCLSETGEISSELGDAESEVNDALDIAREEGHDDHVAALELALEFIDILEAMQAEVVSLCEAGQDEDWDAFDDHLEKIEDLDQERMEKEQEVDAAFEDIE